MINAKKVNVEDLSSYLEIPFQFVNHLNYINYFESNNINNNNNIGQSNNNNFGFGGRQNDGISNNNGNIKNYLRFIRIYQY